MLNTKSLNDSASERLIANQKSHRSQDLEQIFAQCFGERYQTVLCGGASEPLYLPANSDENTTKNHIILYRDDYFASALHEVAHWCIAGHARRLQVDYGYWYAEDGRNAKQQAAFESVEVKPQAIEWAFTKACKRQFSVSIDNLHGNAGDSLAFTQQVAKQLSLYVKQGFPARAQQFITALTSYYQHNTFDESNLTNLTNEGQCT